VSQGPNLPNWLRGSQPKGGSKSDSEPQNIVWADSPINQEIIWEESDDVYKPIPKKLTDFKLERGISEIGPKRVYIKDDALKNLATHLESNLRIEQGGILFGNAYEDPMHGIYVEITAAVPAPATIGTGAHLDFTPESWVGIMDYAKYQHPQENIVGWYHSHPGIGVFMSGTDMNTQRAFFYHPWCLSIVYDPVHRMIGYFLGENASPVEPVIWPRSTATVRPQPRTNQPAYPVIHQTDITSIPIQPGTRLNPPVDNPNEQPEHQTSDIQPHRPQKKEYSLGFVLLMVLLTVVITLVGTRIWDSHNSSNTLIPPDQTVFVTPSFKVEARIITMSAQLFEDFQNLNLFKYSVVPTGDRIGTEGEISLLVISLPEETEEADNFQLEIQEITLKPDQPLPDNAALIEYMKNQASSSGENTKDANSPLKTLELDSLSQNRGVFIPIWSFDIEENSGDQEPKRVVRDVDVIYIPRNLTYTDGNNRQQKIDILTLLRDG
jgi:proteasome lid subunit RPN8/RPN11